MWRSIHPKPKRGELPRGTKPVVVVWEDPFIDFDTVNGQAEVLMEYLEPDLRYTIGWLVGKDAAKVEVAFVVDPTPRGTLSYENVWFIHRALVTQIIPLSIAAGPPRKSRKKGHAPGADSRPAAPLPGSENDPDPMRDHRCPCCHALEGYHWYWCKNAESNQPQTSSESSPPPPAPSVPRSTH